MTTLALLGLLVVLLVAIGIAAFLLRGRNRADESGADDEPVGPPRTVRDLVDRRRTDARPDTPEPSEDAAPAAPGPQPSDAAERTADVEPSVDATTPVAPVDGASADDPGPTAAAVAAGGTAVVGAAAAEATDGAEDDTVPTAEIAPTDAGIPADPTASSDTDTTASVDAIDPDDPDAAGSTTAPHRRMPTARSGSDVDAGPVGPPWARGFVDGRPIEPPQEAETGPVEAVAERPTPPPRQESRSPVDPDLVKRVTAVPGERSMAARTTSPDTEREFREARDRIIAQPAAGRVPEQAGPSTAAVRRPSPVPVPDRERTEETRHEADTAGNGARVGAAALGVAAIRGAESTGGGDPSPSGGPMSPSGGPTAPSDGPTPPSGVRPSPAPRPVGGPPVGPDGEPAPRPAPRLMRSTASPSGPDLDEAGAAPEPAFLPDSDVAPEPEIAPEPDIAQEPDEAATPDVLADPLTTPGPVADPAPVVAFTSSRRPRSEPVPGTGAQDVRVEVAGRDGTLLAGVTVVLRDGAGTEVGTRTTDDAGVAVLRAPGAGRYVVVASSDDHQPGVATCSVADQQREVTVTMTRSAAVHGVVRSAVGSPMAGVQITLDQDGDPVARTDTGTDGAFRITDLGAGYYRLLAGTGAGSASSALRLAGEADVEQDLQLAGD